MVLELWQELRDRPVHKPAKAGEQTLSPWEDGLLQRGRTTRQQGHRHIVPPDDSRRRRSPSHALLGAALGPPMDTVILICRD